MGEIAGGAGGEPRAIHQLLALLPLRRGPDVLGMGGAAPGQAGQMGGIAGNRGRGMQIMHVEQADIGRQLGRQNQRLAEAADPVGARIAAQIAQPQSARGGIARPVADRLPGPAHPRRRVLQIFRQIAHRRPDRAVQPMHLMVGRLPQRHDLERQPMPLQAEDLLGDEGLGQARIALDQDGDARARRHAAGVVRRCAGGRRARAGCAPAARAGPARRSDRGRP